jgi:polysaccharide biosynthesis transport protein
VSANDVGRPGVESESLVQALRMIRRRWMLLALVALACMGGAVANKALGTEEYEASANVVFGAPVLSDAALQVDRVSSDPEREAATNVLIAGSDEVAAGVRSALETDESPGDLLDQVSVEAEENANVLVVTATDRDPAQAAALANAFADQYIAFKRRSEVQSIRAAEENLQRQLRELPTDAPERADLQQSLQRLTELRAVATGDARVIGRASAPSTPAGLSVVTVAALGLIVGLACGLILVFLLESLDRRINTIADLEREYRLEGLTSVGPRGFRHERAEDRADDLEPYRILRTVLDYARTSRPLDAVMVTSAVPGEGKTTVAVDLAHTIALTGRRVVLIELDLRRPTFGQHLNLDPRRGVTTALLQREPVSSLLQRPFEALPELSVLPSGRLPPNPAELLVSPAMNDMLAELSRGGAMVIIDAPPLIPVADAQVLLNHSAIDAVLIAARLGVVTRDQVRRARAVIDRHLLEPLGLVITGLQDEEPYGYASYPSAGPTDDADIDAAPLPPASRRLSG